MEHAALVQWHEKTCKALHMAQETLRLIYAVDDRDFMERPARLAKALIRVTWGEGLTGIVIDRQQDLSVLAHIGKNHLKDALFELTDAGVLLIHPDSGLYEVLPNVEAWKVRPRCQRGIAYAQERHVELVQADWRSRRQQGDLAQVEESFQPEPTLQQIIGQNARDEADPVRPSVEQSSVTQDMASSRPGADESEQDTHPPGFIGTEKPVGPRRLSEAVRQVMAGGGKVPGEGTFPSEPPPKVPSQGTSLPREFPERELPTRAGVRSSGYLTSSGKRELQLPSGDHPDHLKAADERCGAEESQMMVGCSDELLGDIRRKLGGLPPHYELFWRQAIAASRLAAAHALEAIKYANRDSSNPGGYMRTAFYNACESLNVRLPDFLEHRRPQKRPRHSEASAR